MLVKKTTMENTMTSEAFVPAMELRLLKTMVFTCMVSLFFSSCGRTKEFFSFIKSQFASSFKFDSTAGKSDRDNLKSSSSSLLCNHTVVIGCRKNSKFFIF